MLPTLFVSIAAYRDPECSPTLADLYANAAHPSRIHVGLCWQYQPSLEPGKPAVPEAFSDHIRIKAFAASQSKGAGWAKHQAQQLYSGEDYVLLIDSHMRFVAGWDEILLQQLQACTSHKPVLSHLPPTYTPPNQKDPYGKLTVLRANHATAAGNIRILGETLDTAPPAPLRGAFAAPGFMAAKGALLAEVPHDPVLYFEQEEICTSARLFTHGWDVFHPSTLIAYHLYDTTAVTYTRHKHWHDNDDWSIINQVANERRDHLLGVQLSGNEAALTELDQYGHGDARSLDEYAAYCGIHFAAREVTTRALTCGFIANLKNYRHADIAAPATVAQKATASLPASESSGRKPVPTAFDLAQIHNFTPASWDVLSTPIYCPAAINADPAEYKAPTVLRDGVPPGVLIIEHYASDALCRYLRDHADQIAGTKLNVVDDELSTSTKVVTKASSGRVTEYVSINKVADEILSIFLDIHCHRLAPFFGVNFEWFERPQILRYPPGGKYDPHADAEHLNPQTQIWMRSLDRDLSVLLYLNDDYEGGALGFDNVNFTIQPRQGMLIAFPSDHRYLHAARPTTSGKRYVIVSWSAVVGSARVKDHPPYASVILHLPS